ncbi:hypothetical protein FDECE_6849 [Fusarium decemcellulare]|nr:hypothetical protein FDECE_6849 [Fusarium decemcellulare]
MSLSTLKLYHKKPYPGLDPSRAALRQTGKTVVVTGGNSGIGYALARGFVSAGAKGVIILGRRPDVVESAAVKLQSEATQLGQQTLVEGRVCDIADLGSTEALWKSLESDSIYVDILVLSAAAYGAVEPILQGGFSKFWVNISTCAAYMWTTMGPDRPTYGLTKNASTLLLQQIAKDTDAADMQVISFHPGGILTDSAKKLGGDAIKGLVFDDENLPGHFAVWAANPEARFLHGRFVWANWDIEELQSGPIRQQIDQDEHFLKVGVEGLSEKMGGMIMS